MTTAILIQLITTMALVEGVNPETALTIAKIESNYNIKAIGPVKEVGLFQIHPLYSKFSPKQLQDPIINIKEGLRVLKEAKAKCKHQLDKMYVICFNTGVVGGNKIKFPSKFPYYVKFVQTREQLRKKIQTIGSKNKVYALK